MTTNVVVNAGDDYLAERAVDLPPAVDDDGNPIDLTGYDLTFMVAERVSGDVVIIKTSDYGQIDVGYQEYGRIGVAAIELFGMDTIALGNGPMNYELTGVDYDFRERTLLQGRFYVTTGLTDGS